MSFVKSPIFVISTFIWIGFVCAISFMEAWLKFRAPGIDLGLGLGIGRIVFNALNKVEWVLALAILLNLFLSQQKIMSLKQILFFVPLVILIIQTFYLLPVLDARAEMHIQNQVVPPSNIHFYYVGAELVKVISLAIFGILQFQSTSNPNSNLSRNFQI